MFVSGMSLYLSDIRERLFNMKTKIKILLTILPAWIILYGCTYTHNVNVYISPELKEQYGYYPSLEVDIAGLNADEKNWMETYDIDKYFEAENPMRASLKPLTIKFSQDKAGMQYITRESRFWREWNRKGAKETFVIVNLPETAAAGQNSRKLNFKIRSNIFKSHSKYIVITRAGLTSLPKPPEWAAKRGRKADAF